eukprot:GHVR01074294.1.p1 GENE.GHVR01074294.1~~GHVR01074294.1.p1  ORF type:complete len:146 (-),score=12.99 GHVR01074294.1:227-664(-)
MINNVFTIVMVIRYSKQILQFHIDGIISKTWSLWNQLGSIIIDSCANDQFQGMKDNNVSEESLQKYSDKLWKQINSVGLIEDIMLDIEHIINKYIIQIIKELFSEISIIDHIINQSSFFEISIIIKMSFPFSQTANTIEQLLNKA